MKKTIMDLIKEGVTKFRRDPWNEYAYVTLDIVKLKDGTFAYGPWAHVHDVMQYLGKEKPINIPSWECEDFSVALWEPWVDPGPMPAQKGEADGQAKAAL